jgi:hypothetical protein
VGAPSDEKPRRAREDQAGHDVQDVVVGGQDDGRIHAERGGDGEHA